MTVPPFSTVFTPLVEGPLGSAVAVGQRVRPLLHPAAAPAFRARMRSLDYGLRCGHWLRLSLAGVGFRLWRRRSALLLDLGRSALVLFLLPKGLKAAVGRTGLLLVAADRSLLGRTAAHLLRLRRPDPYRFKGVRRLDRPLPPPRRRRRDGKQS